MKLEEAGLRLNKDKCRFMQSEVVYLGHVIDKTGLHPDKGRIQAIREAPRPQNVTELKAYLGLLSYYGNSSSTTLIVTKRSKVELVM